MLRQKEIEQLRKEVEQLKVTASSCIAFILKNEKYCSGATENIGSIKLPKGKFVITISFLIKSTQNWIYLKLDNKGKDVLNIPN